MGRIECSIDVNAPVAICYAIWSDFESFPRFMKHVESVQPQGEPNVWRWKVNGPMGKPVTWDAKVDSLQPNKAVSWHSVRDSEVDNSGAVTFKALGPDRTHVTAVISYETPAGGLGEMVAAIFSNPDHMVKDDLNSFKELAESGVYAREPVGVGSSSNAAYSSDRTINEREPVGVASGYSSGIGATDYPNVP